MLAARSLRSSPSHSALALIISDLPDSRSGRLAASTSGKSMISNMPVGSEKETKAYIWSLRPRLAFLDQRAGDLGLEPAAAAVFQKRGISGRAQPLQGRAIGIQRMAREIKAH